MTCNVMNADESLLQVDISGTFTLIDGVIDIPTDSRGSREVKETKCLADAAGSKSVGKRTTGEMTFNVYYDPASATQDFLRTSFDNGDTEDWKIVDPDGTTEKTFSGFISAISEPRTDGEDVIQSFDVAKTTVDVDA